MKTLLTYVPLFGCSAMMVVCLLIMCGSRLWRRTPTQRASPALAPADAATPTSPTGATPEVLAELAALRDEVAELRRTARPDSTDSRPAAARAKGATWVSWAGGDPHHLIVSGEGPAAASADGANTWAPIRLPTGASIVEASPIDPTVWYAAALDGTHARVWISRDAGTAWQRS